MLLKWQKTFPSQLNQQPNQTFPFLPLLALKRR